MSNQKLDLILTKLQHMEDKITSMDNRLSSVEDKITSMDNRLSSVEDKIISMDNRLSSVEDKIISMDNRINSVEDKITSMDNRINSVEDKITSMDNRINSVESNIKQVKAEQQLMKEQLKEHSQIMKAIHHRQEETDAKLEGLSLDVANIHENVVSIQSTMSQYQADQQSIKELVGEHEVSIRSLRRMSV